MHRSRLLTLGIVVILMMGSAALVLGQSEEEMIVPMGTIVIGPPESVEAKRSPVEFPHAVHFKYECRTCHHKCASSQYNQYLSSHYVGYR